MRGQELVRIWLSLDNSFYNVWVRPESLNVAVALGILMFCLGLKDDFGENN